MILDAHIHMFRPDQMPTADSSYLARLPTYLRLLFTPTKYNHTRQGWATCERMIEIMDEEGIDRVCVLGPEDDYTAGVYRRFPDRLLPFKYLDMPALARDRRAELNRMRRFIEEEGFVGFGEHHPDPAGNGLTEPDVLAVMDLACELGVPVNLHVSEPVGHFYYGKSHNPAEEYLWLAQRFPDLRLILSHWGGGLAFLEAIPALRPALRNCHYDTTASKLFYDVRKSMETITRLVPEGKIFYGSDFPLLLHPDEYPDELDPRFRIDRADFLQSQLPAAMLDGIMGLNFARFLGLAEARSSSVPPAKPRLLRTPAPAAPAPRFLAETTLTAQTSVYLAALQYPETRDVFARHGIPCFDARVNPWLSLIQPLAQHGIWFAEGFAEELRAALPPGEPLRELDDLDLVHTPIRELSARFPAARPLFDRHGLNHRDTPVPPWETIGQASARRGVWPCDDLLAELNAVLP